MDAPATIRQFAHGHKSTHSAFQGDRFVPESAQTEGRDKIVWRLTWGRTSSPTECTFSTLKSALCLLIAFGD